MALPVVSEFERLPKNVQPIHYEITIKPDLVKLVFDGYENVTLKVAIKYYTLKSYFSFFTIQSSIQLFSCHNKLSYFLNLCFRLLNQLII